MTLLKLSSKRTEISYLSYVAAVLRKTIASTYSDIFQETTRVYSTVPLFSNNLYLLLPLRSWDIGVCEQFAIFATI